MSVETPPIPASVRSNPYVGPESFRRGDRIYGRDRAAAELLDLLVAERVVLLHSPSGAGKTSLIQARMLSLLEEDNFAVLPVVRLNHDVPAELAGTAAPVNRYVLSAIASLEEGLPEQSQTPVTALAGMTLAEYVSRRPRAEDHPGSTVLIIDQFEEVITADPVDQAAKRVFFRQLGELLGDRTVWALMSMREDFLAELDPYTRLVPTRFLNRYRLDLLTEAEALDAMIFPARDAGVDFEAAAAGKLVDDLRTVRLQRGNQVIEELGPYVEPVQLQVVCRGVWDRKSADATHIGLSDVEAVGNVDEALAAYYADCMSSTAKASGVPERALREWCEQELITPQGFRGQAMHGPEVSQGSAEQVVALLTAAHLLRAESRRGAVWFELAHDRLIDPIKEDNEQWRRTNLSDVERRAALWEDQSRSDGLLLTGDELREAEAWVASRSGALTEVERDFLAASRRIVEQAQREARANRRIRRWLVVAVVGFVLAVVASAFAITSTNRANEATLKASEAAALGQSLGNLPEDVQLSLRLAIKASALRDSDSGALSDETMAVLQQAVDASPVLRVFRGADSPVQQAVYSRDGTRIASMHDDLTLRVWESDSGKLVWSQKIDGDYPMYALSADGKRVAAGVPEGLRMWDVGSKASRLLVPGLAVDALSFSPDGAWLVAHELTDTGEEDGSVTPGTEPEPSDAGRLLAVSTSTGSARDLPTGGGWDLQWSGDGPWGPKGAQLVSVGDVQLKVWAGATTAPRLVALPEGAGGAVISKRGGLLAVMNEDRVDLYRGLGARKISSVAGNWVSMSLSADGRRLLVVGMDDRLSVHDTSTGELLRRVGQAGTWLSTAEFDPRQPDRALVVGGDTNTGTSDVVQPMIWDLLPGSGEQQVTTGFGVAGDKGMTSSDSGVVRLWSSEGHVTQTVDLRSRLGLPAPTVVEDPEGNPDGPVYEGGAFFPQVALSPSGSFLAVATDQTGPAYVVPLDPKKKPVRLPVSDPTHAIISLAVSRTGRYVVGGYTAYPPESEPIDLEGPPTGPVVGEPSLGGTDVPVENAEGGLYVWEAATGSLVNHWKLKEGEPYGLAISRDEREVFGMAQVLNRAVVWDLATGTARLAIAPKAATPSAAPSGRPQVVPGEDGETGEPTFVAVAWSTESNLIATAQDDNRLLLWDARTGAQLAELATHTGMVVDLAFDATGGRLATVGDDKMLVLWDTRTHQPIRTIKHDSVQGVDFLQTKRRLLVVHDDGRMSVVWLDGRELLDAAKARSTRELTPAECSRYLGEEDICRTD